jgi:lipoteichoic acid synthase
VVEQDMFLTMGRQLQARGYSSGSFHNNDHTYYSRNLTHEKLGYDKFLAWGNGLEGQVKDRSDEEMIVATVEKFLDKQPFSLYYMSLSGHSPYTFGNSIAKKYAADVQDMDASDPIKAYVACNMSLEYGMRRIIERLEELGIADDTVIVISTDHYPYGLAPSDTWGGRGYIHELLGADNWMDENIRDRNALLIWSGCLEDMDLVVEEPVSSLDILPTLSNLFGVEYDSRMMTGRDVFSDSEAVVFWPLTYSWKTAKGFYNSATGVFTPAEGVEVPENYVESITAKVKNKCVFSKAVQQHNYYSVISALVNLEDAG